MTCQGRMLKLVFEKAAFSMSHGFQGQGPRLKLVFEKAAFSRCRF